MCTECPAGSYIGEDGKCHVWNCKEFFVVTDTIRNIEMSFCSECNDGYGIQPMQIKQLYPTL